MKRDEEFVGAGREKSSRLPADYPCVFQSSAAVATDEDISAAVNEDEPIGIRPSEQPASHSLTLTV